MESVKDGTDGMDISTTEDEGPPEVATPQPIPLEEADNEGITPRDPSVKEESDDEDSILVKDVPLEDAKSPARDEDDMDTTEENRPAADDLPPIDERSSPPEPQALSLAQSGPNPQVSLSPTTSPSSSPEISHLLSASSGVNPLQTLIYPNNPVNLPTHSSMIATPSSDPHYTVTTIISARPISNSSAPPFNELHVTPKEYEETPPLQPLLSEYALSLYPLPPNPATSKKSKKKDRGAGGKPLELIRWQAMMNFNPVHRLLRKTTKCISSQEWAVAYSEVRFLKAMQHVERLKSIGLWSFKQPKRSRGPTLTKVHWDWVLDEMVNLSFQCI